MSDRILVTGGTGTIGYHLLKYLKEQDTPFTVFARNPKKAATLKGRGYEVILGDFDDKDSVDEAMQGIGKLFLNSPAGPQQVDHQRTVIEAAISNKVKHIVKVSTIDASPDSSLNIGRWHYEIEKAIRDSGIGYTFLHANGFMQNFFAYADSIRNLGRIYAPFAQGKYSAVDARDVAMVAARILAGESQENQEYELTGPTAVGMRDVARAISTAINKEVRYVPIAPEDARSNMRNSGMPDWLVEDMLELSKKYEEGHGSRVSGHIRNVTGNRATDLSRFTEENWRQFA
ncbi:SDR family oxidoreductase [Roseivirga sp. BDSF3-8]|uniref:SDR family oxidoreductase n=1 Tax=Roseivirga sp. BDSF3-8 TaxID=3241598 RepID=UPI0035318F96